MEGWEEVYRREGRVFEETHSAMSGLMVLFREKGVTRVLDLGSGSGRHTLLLAENRFEVYGIDISSTGVEITRQTLMEKKLKADVKVGNIYEKLPYLDGFFDAIISVQTLHHNTTDKIRKLIGEMERILSSGGYIFVTVPSKMNQADKFKLIEKGTYMPLDGREKGLPHHFFTREEIVKLFSNFEIEEIHIDQMEHYAFRGIKKN
jgi:SAM-dependent methyltransferase